MTEIRNSRSCRNAALPPAEDRTRAGDGPCLSLSCACPGRVGPPLSRSAVEDERLGRERAEGAGEGEFRGGGRGYLPRQCLLCGRYGRGRHDRYGWGCAAAAGAQTHGRGRRDKTHTQTSRGRWGMGGIAHLARQGLALHLPGMGRGGKRQYKGASECPSPLSPPTLAEPRSPLPPPADC